MSDQISGPLLPTDVPMSCTILLENDVLPRRLATNPDHPGIQKPVQLLDPVSPYHTGCLLLGISALTHSSGTYGHGHTLPVQSIYEPTSPFNLLSKPGRM